MLRGDRKQEDFPGSVWCPDDDADGASLAARFLAHVGLALPEIIEANDVAGLKHDGLRRLARHRDRS